MIELTSDELMKCLIVVILAYFIYGMFGNNCMFGDNGFSVGAQSLTLDYIREQMMEFGNGCPKDPMEVCGIGVGLEKNGCLLDDVCTPILNDSTLKDCTGCTEALQTYFGEGYCPNETIKAKYNSDIMGGLPSVCPGSVIH